MTPPTIIARTDGDTELVRDGETIAIHLPSGRYLAPPVTREQVAALAQGHMCRRQSAIHTPQAAMILAAWVLALLAERGELRAEEAADAAA